MCAVSDMTFSSHAWPVHNLLEHVRACLGAMLSAVIMLPLIVSLWQLLPSTLLQTSKTPTSALSQDGHKT